ncbi:MAG: efflux RND transporter periplasmic adaptor subunit [Verrucomicrobia bacterium]|nr:efflux RND transporter periplasmic adaptor subunit [Verrucomicrobiota bacterium]
MITPHRVSLVLIPVLTLFVGCGRHEKQAAPSGPPLRVAVAVVEQVEEPDSMALPGTVRAVDRAVISAKVAGTISDLPWGLGQHVQAGVVLVKLSAPEYAAQVSRARTQLEQAERELARDKSLSERGAGTDEAVRRGAEQVQSAKAALAEAEAMLSYTEIRAPFDARITARQAYPGDMALPGQTLLTLEGEGSFEVEVAVPESSIANVKLGDQLPVELQAGRVNATVAEIAAGADVASRSVMVKLRLAADARVSSGQFVRVWFAGPAVKKLRVPVGAINVFGQMERAFVISDGKANLRLVKTGERVSGKVAVLSGLDAGEKLVAAPTAALRDGQPVEVQP